MRRLALIVALALIPSLAFAQTTARTVTTTTTVSVPTATPTLVLAQTYVRNDCTITSTVAFTVSTSSAGSNAIPVAANALFKCASLGAIMIDNLYVTQTSGSAQNFIVWSQ